MMLISHRSQSDLQRRITRLDSMLARDLTELRSDIDTSPSGHPACFFAGPYRIVVDEEVAPSSADFSSI
jgi:hypothetical protein